MHFIVRRAAAAPATKAPPTQPPSYAESAAAKSNNSGGSSGFDIFLVLIAVFSVLNIGLIIAVIILSRAKNQSATARSTSQTGSGRSTRIGSVAKPKRPVGTLLEWRSKTSVGTLDAIITDMANKERQRRLDLQGAGQYSVDL
uniref:Uncharacterized protein n=1 Tax=Macrostomum lignano TaxID=282301 RepID=A0A1I8I3S2_9PLAT